ncbi:FtsW/RodA/SpoVE family cell cycle protein, partial [Streptomyces sp. NPDC052127]
MTKAGVGPGTGAGAGAGTTSAGTTVAAADAPAPAALLPRRRGVELSLIVLAVLLSVYGYCAVGLAKDGTVPPGAAGYGAGLGVL